MTSIPEARASFNLKVLRRHDPSIVSIVETASFVVLYNYNGGEWTKTGVEGPLFLFRRRLPPYNGFFLMNRNGVENFSADVTPDDDLEITPEFIIYRPESSGDNEVYGIWVFEPNQRMAVGDKMLKLQAMADAPSEEEIQAANAVDRVPPAVGGDGKAAASGGKDATQPEKEKEKEGKGKGKANGKPKRGAKQAAEKSKDTDAKEEPVAAVENEGSTQINLDDLFGSAPTQSADPSDGQHASFAPEQPPTEAASNGSSLLDSLFQSAVSLDSTSTPSASVTEAPKAASTESTSTTTNSNNNNNHHTQNLLSLLGSSTVAASAPAEAATTASSQPSESASQAEQPSTEKAGGAPKMAELLEQNIRDRIGLGDDGQPLSRREFVTELLSMVHTNPDFVTELYNSYVARVS